MIEYAVKLPGLGGGITIVTANDIDSARRWALEEFGRIAEPVVTKAKDEDVTWVKAMGGAIHEA